MSSSKQNWVILATGPSLTQADCDYARAKGWRTVAVSNAFALALWADYLVSHDSKWWRAYPDALEFHGRKFCRQGVKGTELFIPSIRNGCNSGLMAMEVARDIGEAETIILLGFDMQGSHYFGNHEAAYGKEKHQVLRNTTPRRFVVQMKQFERWTGPRVINATPGSQLHHFPKANLYDIL